MANSEQDKGGRHFVVVGAGIVGVCIAYYLLQNPRFDKSKDRISILESKRVAGGASGKAGGLLALWAFPQQIVPLSFQLHQDLAAQFGGEDEWGYRRLTTVSVEGDISDDRMMQLDPERLLKPLKAQQAQQKQGQQADSAVSAKPMSRATIKKNSIEIESSKSDDSKLSSHLPKNLSWIDNKVINDWSQLGNKSTTAQVHPYQFTTFMLKQCLSTGCVELIIGKVDDILINEDGQCEGVIYHPSSAQAEYDGTSEEKIELLGDEVIMSIGPWTSKILPDCPISGLRAHSIIIEPENVNEISPYAVFTELKLNKNKFVSPEIYARKDEVYVCGEGDSSVLIPETTDDVEVVNDKCEELFKYVSKLSPNLSKGKILKKQACYLPVLDIPSSSGPLIGETNVPKLYLASGHSCWGINNAPATGLLMAEILLEGEAKSCDISALNPSLYFDASLVFDESGSEVSSVQEGSGEGEDYDEAEEEEGEFEEEYDDDDDDDNN